jgi:hypothetical protein
MRSWRPLRHYSGQAWRDEKLNLNSFTSVTLNSRTCVVTLAIISALVNGKESAMKRGVFGLFLLLALNSDLQAQSTFYAGKSIKLIVGSPAGSNYDQYGRLVAPYLGKYIAGHPDVIVQNMGGAGSVIAANHVYRLAAPEV